ncbi:hypothetical protein LWI29_003011 [Acer saccharum]|uniref:Glycosyltransferase n=1 Tax=Acer saccharum TaxID=4024 RepID=A0AA39VK28_ACESA|nr:hypothetical protein LWI29_003011 [Acer saccharum]
MENLEGDDSCKSHCLVLSYPMQGHINPLLQFSKRLQHKGIKVTLVNTRFISKTIHRASSNSSIALETISDGYDEGGVDQAESFPVYLKRFEQVGSQTLSELVEKMNGSGFPIDCIVYDSCLPWALSVARKFGLVGAIFLTQSCAVDCIFYHVYKGLLKLPLTDNQVSSLPGLPPLEPQDMPSYIYNYGSQSDIFEVIFDVSVYGQFSTGDEADWVLCNTFYELEKEVVEWLGKFKSLLKTVGPTIPSMYLDKQLEDDKGYGFNIFKPNSDACMKWLTDRAKGSVVYVSFGSAAKPKAEQMEELAYGLKASDKHFLWVVRASEQAKLPENFVSQKGLVVSWCPQLDVLANEAIGCFVTHCGWNSTLEALSFGIPMVAMPQSHDQSTNAKYIMDVWKMGLKPEADHEKGIVKREAIENCIREILEGERGKEIKNNADKWKRLAREAMVEGGSSDKNIDEFVASLVISKTCI